VRRPVPRRAWTLSSPLVHGSLRAIPEHDEAPSGGAHPACADAEEPDTEEPDVEDPDAEEPDTEEPDVEDPDTEDEDSELEDHDAALAVIFLFGRTTRRLVSVDGQIQPRAVLLLVPAALFFFASPDLLNDEGGEHRGPR
jgi:hypothetical protein